MKILYGIQGTGNGHITRARAMAKAFSSAKVDIDYFFSGRTPDQYFDMADFNNYQTREGFTFAIENGSVKKLKTLKNVKINHFIQDVRKLDVSGYDLVINDFEPVTAWAAKLSNTPCIGISHQASFISHKVPIQNAGMLTRLGLTLFAPADCYLGVHWFPFSRTIIPPFIEPINNWHNGQCIKNKILVYLPFEAPADVISMLSPFREFEFYCYHPNVTEQTINQHIHLREPSRLDFLNDMALCSGVIGNAGFELSSEALRYGKKILLKPLEGQFEQASNALTLSKFGLATSMTYLNKVTLENWLLGDNKQPINFPSDPKPLVDWLLAGDHDTSELSEILWDNIELPAL